MHESIFEFQFRNLTGNAHVYESIRFVYLSWGFFFHSMLLVVVVVQIPLNVCTFANDSIVSHTIRFFFLLAFFACLLFVWNAIRFRINPSSVGVRADCVLCVHCKMWAIAQCICEHCNLARFRPPHAKYLW